ncbi:MAG: hypothetical protein Q8Q12_03765, partial [bacterium]|nr:hypothetical protein [bacterium]
MNASRTALTSLSLIFALLALASLPPVGAAESIEDRSVEPSAAAKRRDYAIPTIDLSGDTHRQIIVDKEPGQYLGHPSSVLLKDNRTII